jgi:hypothetical protein
MYNVNIHSHLFYIGNGKANVVLCTLSMTVETFALTNLRCLCILATALQYTESWFPLTGG